MDAATSGANCLAVSHHSSVMPCPSSDKKPVSLFSERFAAFSITCCEGSCTNSLSSSPNPLIKSTTKGLEVNKHGGIIVEEGTGLTSRQGVYAGGDAVTGAATVISAMGAGKTAAKAIDEYLSKK